MAQQLFSNLCPAKF